MKVRVSYTYEIEGEDLLALERYLNEKATRDGVRQLLKDIGLMGVEEQIAEGGRRLKGEADQKALDI